MDLFGHLLADRKGDTMLEKKELCLIYGGSISGTLINAIVKGINSLLELGRSVGSAIRRGFSGNLCDF